MKWNPSLSEAVCFDFETIEIQPDGSTRGSTEAYRKNFRVDSAAFTWLENGELKSAFVRGEDAVGHRLHLLGDKQLLVFNAQFETLVALCRYPDLKLNITLDAQRLAQNYDNGGPDDAFETIIIEPENEDDEATTKKRPLTGFSLVKCSKRILGEGDHKAEAHEWLRNHAGIKKGQEGANLDKLPHDVLERYNVADTEVTFRLANHCLNYFDEIGYDWRLDHGLYFGTLGYVAKTKQCGVAVNREQLAAYIEQVKKELDQIATDFLTKFAEPIQAVERAKLLEEIRNRKTLRGRKKYLKRIRSDAEKWNDDIAFNVGSNKQLEALFVGVLGMQPTFFTAKEQPSFKSSVLGQWGDGGLMLQKRRKRLIVLKQAEALLELSAVTGRWHLNLRMVGTSSGRMSGGYG